MKRWHHTLGCIVFTTDTGPDVERWRALGHEWIRRMRKVRRIA